jgi:hypothetical protein
LTFSDPALVVLGNGPSLRGFDFTRLAAFDCIGMNAAYRYWHEIGWYPRYYACLDLVVGISHKEAIADLIRGSDATGIEFFFLRANLIDTLPEELRRSHKLVNFDRLGAIDGFAAEPLTTGSHAALFGAHLGYRQLVLLGIDCDYVEKVEGAKEAGGVVLELAETPKNNPNYFFANYQVAGDRYNLPNTSPGLHVRSWRAIAPFVKARGVEVWNCSPYSRVDAFLFRHFREIEAEAQKRTPPPRAVVPARLGRSKETA